VGAIAEARGKGRRRACYDAANAPATCERRNIRVSTTGERTLNVGDPAPDFTLKSIGLKEVSLRDYRGKNVVLLFYPLDWTPG
jgi:hypothetical protein